ncbi:MAG: S9 family peptidase, partial [Gammaproteobacteria bacterium]|nr:S9 family peptidase [Gammaproteobacteria bacterium]
MSINRRELLQGVGACTAAYVARNPVFAAEAIPPAPVARVEVVKDTYFGETLSDPYRWMENDKDPEWLPFLKGQDAHTRAVLARIPGRDALLRRIQQLSGDTALTRRAERYGERLFFEQRPAGADNYKLFVVEGGTRRTLIDPTLRSGPTGHYSLDWWQPSPDGSKVVYGLSKDGSEDSVLHVLSVADGKDLPDAIPDTQSAQPNWLDDGSGFFYNQLTGKVDTPERYLDSRARFHRLGTDPGQDPILMQRGKDPRVAYEKIQAPYINTFYGADHALLMLADVRSETRVLIAPLADVLTGKAA